MSIRKTAPSRSSPPPTRVSSLPTKKRLTAATSFRAFRCRYGTSSPASPGQRTSRRKAAARTSRGTGRTGGPPDRLRLANHLLALALRQHLDSHLLRLGQLAPRIFPGDHKARTPRHAPSRLA